MPAGEHPVRAHDEGVGVVSKVKQCDGGPAGGRQADHLGPVLGPAKMFRPAPVSGIKERHLSAGVRISSRRVVRLETIAERTAQPEVRLDVGTTLGEE